LQQNFSSRLDVFSEASSTGFLQGIRRGIEKESLRIQPDGQLAQTPHPKSLGSALTHPGITTDYSEALLEFISKVHRNIPALMQNLDEIHRFVYEKLSNELLWVASMPCILRGDENIPLAQYGSSNIAKMKTIYRNGLGLRYGRLMQTIAGIHYNFSLPDDFWPWYRQAMQCDEQSLRDFKTESYFSLIRNFQRYSWLLVYLFGASPAVCKSFVAGRYHQLEPLGQSSLCMPYGTSLRMGDLGYQSTAQEALYVSYNGLEDYLQTLHRAITTPHPAYEAIGIKKDGQYLQLNSALLQIENEFYSAIRPKRVTQPGETPRRALYERGVEYIEVRCLDVNPYLPMGFDETQVRFLDAFLVFCLLQPSPPSTREDLALQKQNLKNTVTMGRKPGMHLIRMGKPITLAEWGGYLLGKIRRVAALLDDADSEPLHQEAVDHQEDKIENADLTPSGKILKDLHEGDVPYFHFAMEKAEEQQRLYQTTPLDEKARNDYERLATKSLQEQVRIEQADNQSFEDYLEDYFSQ
jgi:glutamate--cysteine ligase